MYSLDMELSMELKASSSSGLGLGGLRGLLVSLWKSSLGEALRDRSSVLRGGLGELYLQCVFLARSLSSSATDSWDWWARSGW